MAAAEQETTMDSQLTIDVSLPGVNDSDLERELQHFDDDEVTTKPPNTNRPPSCGFFEHVSDSLHLPARARRTHTFERPLIHAPSSRIPLPPPHTHTIGLSASSSCLPLPPLPHLLNPNPTATFSWRPSPSLPSLYPISNPRTPPFVSVLQSDSIFFAKDPGKEQTRPFFEKRAKTKYSDTAVRLAHFLPLPVNARRAASTLHGHERVALLRICTRARTNEGAVTRIRPPLTPRPRS